MVGGLENGRDGLTGGRLGGWCGYFAFWGAFVALAGAWYLLGFSTQYFFCIQRTPANRRLRRGTGKGARVGAGEGSEHVGELRERAGEVETAVWWRRRYRLKV